MATPSLSHRGKWLLTVEYQGMNWYKAAQQTQKLPRIQDDAFGDFFNEPPRKEVSRDSPKTTSVTLTLYRGFDVDVNKLQRSGQGYVLSPSKSEQGAMWFTHKLIRGYDPIQYVQGRGSHLLTYPLQCVKHSQTIHYSDGSTYDTIPEEIQQQTEGTDNCRFYAGYELPDGWYFSYKNEKFIICTVPITVAPNMITENKGGEDELV